MSTQLKAEGPKIKSPLIDIDVDQCDNQVPDIGNSDGNGSKLQTGLRETNPSGGMSNIDSYRRDLAFFRQLTNSRTMAASRLNFAGAMLARTGSHCNCVDFTVPLITKSVVQLHIDFAGMHSIQPYWSAVFCISVFRIRMIKY
jgi:hypothetical protein